MEYLETNWTDEELKAYLTFYCIHADFSKIDLKLDSTIFNIKKSKLYALQQEFFKDNDYQSIQKICSVLEKNNYSSNSLNFLFEEIKETIIQTGRTFNYLMKNICLGLERNILKAA